MIIKHTIHPSFIDQHGKEVTSDLEVFFIEGWTTKNLSECCAGKNATASVSLNLMVKSIKQMNGPALTLSDGANHPAMMIFDLNKIAMGDIAHQVNTFFDYVMETLGDRKKLVNDIYEKYIEVIEGVVTESLKTTK